MKAALDYIEKNETVDMKVLVNLVVENPDIKTIYKSIKDTNE
jgi:hypothetical protein